MANFVQIRKGIPYNVEVAALGRNYDLIYTITSEDIAEKRIVLSFIPEFPERIKLTPDGGPLQVYGVDYIIVNRNEITWEGLGLDGFLETDEVVFINYFA
jgi:hypothetical protein